MKITEIKVNRYAPERAPAGMPGRNETVVVEVETDGGVTGRAYFSAGAAGDIATLILRRNLRSVVIDQDPLLTGELWQRMYSAIWRLGRRGVGLQCVGAIDCALWDIKGKVMGVPVSTLFGGRRERVPTYCNAGHQLPPDELAAVCAQYVKDGHTTVKIRGSRSAVTLKEATARVAAVREAIGPDVRLMVDVNGTWDVDTAIQQLRAWQKYNVYWLEEPVPPEDIPGYVRVRQKAGDVYIAGGEQHAGLLEFRQLIEQGAVDVVQPNAAVTGGITDWLRIHALATAYNVPVSPWDLQPIHLHMAAGLPNVMWVEYFLADNPLLDFQNRLFAEPKMREVRTDEGIFLLPPEKPGLGIELEPEIAERSLVRDLTP